jgi:hypothetical protein
MRINHLQSCIFVACLALSGCATPIDDQTDLVVAMPARSTSNAEVASAVQELIKTYPVCVTVRPLRLIGRPAVNFNAPGSPARHYEDPEEKLDVLVRLGYVEKTAVPDGGEPAFRYALTDRGKDPNIINRDVFCLPAERLLISVTNIERWRKTNAFGQDGYLVVDFTHELDPKSVWTQDAALVKLMGGKRTELLPGPIKGRALLSRVWMRSEHPLKGAPHTGALWAVSYDPVHNRWEGGRWGAVTLETWKPE